jgi:hypothetical protein
VTSRFVALLDGKAENSNFQPPGGRNAEVHMLLLFFRLSMATTLLEGVGRRASNGRSVSKRRNNQWQFVERAKYAGS